MNTASLPADARPVPIAALAPFLLITFGITYGLIGLYILVPEWMNATFGAISDSHPLFVLCVYAPAIAAFALVLYRGGLSGLRGFLSRSRSSTRWPDAQPYDAAFFALVALAVVWVNRHAMFARSGAATEVIPGSEAPGP